MAPSILAHNIQPICAENCLEHDVLQMM